MFASLQTDLHWDQRVLWAKSHLLHWLHPEQLPWPWVPSWGWDWPYLPWTILRQTLLLPCCRHALIRKVLGIRQRSKLTENSLTIYSYLIYLWLLWVILVRSQFTPVSNRAASQLTVLSASTLITDPSVLLSQGTQDSTVCIRNQCVNITSRKAKSATMSSTKFALIGSMCFTQFWLRIAYRWFSKVRCFSRSKSLWNPTIWRNYNHQKTILKRNRATNKTQKIRRSLTAQSWWQNAGVSYCSFSFMWLWFWCLSWLYSTKFSWASISHVSLNLRFASLSTKSSAFQRKRSSTGS